VVTARSASLLGDEVAIVALVSPWAASRFRSARRRDVLNGGAGRDQARVERRLDRVVSIERLR
jgi:hypothetical protein